MQFLQHKDEEAPYLSWFLVNINIVSANQGKTEQANPFAIRLWNPISYTVCLKKPYG